MNKKLIAGVVVTLVAAAGASSVLASMNETHNSNVKKTEKKATNYTKKEDIPAVKMALEEFKSIEDFNNKFEGVKPEQWIIPDDMTGKSDKIHEWKVFLSQEDALNQGSSKEEVSTGATFADIKEALIVREVDQQLSNEKKENLEQVGYTSSTHEITGENEYIKVKDWEVVNSDNGEQLLKVAFTFENKTDESIDLQKFVQDRIRIGQMIDHKDSKEIKINTNNLNGKKVLKHETTEVVVYSKVLDDTPKNSFVFGMTREKGGEFAGGLTLNF
jgi:hypothetical protein